MAAKLGDILVEKGIINQQQLDAAIAVQGEQQIGQVLINWGWLTQEQLLEALDVQAPPPPPPPPPPVQPQIPQQPMYQQPPVVSQCILHLWVSWMIGLERLKDKIKT